MRLPAGFMNVTTPSASVPTMPSPAASRINDRCADISRLAASDRMSAKVIAARTKPKITVSVARTSATRPTSWTWS